MNEEPLLCQYCLVGAPGTSLSNPLPSAFFEKRLANENALVCVEEHLVGGKYIIEINDKGVYIVSSFVSAPASWFVLEKGGKLTEEEKPEAGGQGHLKIYIFSVTAFAVPKGKWRCKRVGGTLLKG